MSDKNYKQPFYGVDLEVLDVGVEVRVNDIPIYRDEQKGQLSVELPAPDSIIDGTNTLSIQAILPYLDQQGSERSEVFESTANIRATLFVQELAGTEKEVLTSVNLQIDGDKGFVIVEENGFPSELLHTSSSDALAMAKVTIDSSFGEWEWQQGKKIEPTETNFQELMAELRKVHDALSQKDISALHTMYASRAKEAAIAYHLPDTKAGHNKISTGVDMNDTSLSLYAFYEKDMVLEVFGGGKLARIRNNYYRQPILFLDQASKTMHFHKFTYYKNTQDQWVMIR